MTSLEEYLEYLEEERLYNKQLAPQLVLKSRLFHVFVYLFQEDELYWTKWRHWTWGWQIHSWHTQPTSLYATRTCSLAISRSHRQAVYCRSLLVGGCLCVSFGPEKLFTISLTNDFNRKFVFPPIIEVLLNSLSHIGVDLSLILTRKDLFTTGSNRP